jgi:hemoglobin
MRLALVLFLALAATAAAHAATPSDDAAAAAPAETAADPFASPGDAPDPFASSADTADTAEQAAIRAKLAKAPAADPAPVHPELRATFEQFGGEAGLTALMDEFMRELLDDPRTQPFFAQVDQAAVKRHLVEQFCAILGGGCAYTGRDMRTTHAGLGLGRDDFNALVEDLQRAMDRRGIPFAAQNRLLATLAPMHREIEER